MAILQQYDGRGMTGIQISLITSSHSLATVGALQLRVLHHLVGTNLGRNSDTSIQGYVTDWQQETCSLVFFFLVAKGGISGIGRPQWGLPLLRLVIESELADDIVPEINTLLISV
jgi:hypothetical protein